MTFVCSGLTLAIDYNSERGIHTGPIVHMQRSVLDCRELIPKKVSQYVFSSGGGLQAVLDLSMSGRDLRIHFDTLQPYTG